MLQFLSKPLRKFFRSDEHWQKLGFFREVSLFHGLSSRDLGHLMHTMQKRNYHTGEILFTEGQVGKAVFVVESGKVELTRIMPDGKIRSLGTLIRGHIFGEMALLEKMERTATAKVSEDGVIHLLYTADLEDLIRRHPSLGVKILKNMAAMLSALLRRTNKELDRRTVPV